MAHLPLLSKSSSSSSSSTASTAATAHSDDPDPPPITVPAQLSGCGPHKLLSVLSDHSGSISCLALCGEFLLSASHGRDIIIRQHPDLRPLARFGSGAGSAKALAASGSLVLTAHQDSLIRVWRLSRDPENLFKLSAVLPTRKDRLVNCLSQSNYVQTRRHHRKLWIEHADTISSLAVANGLVYSGSWDRTLKVWNLSALKCLESIRAHDDAINALVADSGLVYSASADGKIKIWGESSKNSHCLRATLEVEGRDACWNALVVVGEGRAVYGGGSDGRIVGWERADSGCEGEEARWRVVCDVRAHERAVLCLCTAGEGGEVILCSGSADRSIRVWRRGGGGGTLRRIGVVGGHEGPVKCLQAAEGGGVGGGFVLYSGGFDGSLRVWWVAKECREEGEEEGMKKCVVVVR